MQKIILTPHTGIHIEGIGKVKFGETREKFIEMFGPCIPMNTGTNTRAEYAGYGFFADFKKEDDSFEAIEFWNDHSENKSEVYIYGVEVLKSKAQDLCAILQKENNNEMPVDGWFVNIDVICSGGNPKNIEVIIEQAKADGLFEGDYKDSLLQDLKNASYFSTFGIGYKGYCKNGLEMLNKLLNGE